MGFWTSIIDTAKDIGSWAVDHASDIIGVAGTVAKVIGTVILEEHEEFIKSLASGQDGVEEVNPDFVLPTVQTLKKAQAYRASLDGISSKQTPKEKPAEPFQILPFIDDLKHAEAVLIYEASKNDNITSFNSSRGDGKTITKKGTFPCLFPTPTGINDGQPSREMVADLSRMLAFHNCPQSINLNGKLYDVAEKLAEILFINGTTPSSSDKPVRSEGLTLESTDGDFRVAAAHSYYPIPLGSAAGDSCLHSCIHLKTEISSDLSQRYIDEHLDAHEVSAPVFSGSAPNLGNVSIWQVSAEITWSSAVYAFPFGKRLAIKLKQRYPFIIVSNTFAGNLQFLKVNADINTQHQKVREAIVDAGDRAISEKDTTSPNAELFDDDLPEIAKPAFSLFIANVSTVNVAAADMYLRIKDAGNNQTAQTALPPTETPTVKAT